MRKNRIFVVAGELSTYGKEVFDKLENGSVSEAYFDKRYFERQEKCLSIEELREAQRKSPSFLNILSQTHEPKFIDQNKNRLMMGFEVNHKDSGFQAKLAETCRYINKHRVTNEDLKKIDEFREQQEFQYALLINDDLYDCEDDVELLVRNRVSWYVNQDKPFSLEGSKSIENFLYSFANIWNVHHDKLCRVIHTDPSTTGIINVKFDVIDSKPPIDVEDGIEFGQSLINFLRAPYNYEPQKYATILRTAAKHIVGDTSEFPSLIKAYEELKNPPFNKLKGIQELLKQNKLESFVSSFWDSYHT